MNTLRKSSSYHEALLIILTVFCFIFTFRPHTCPKRAYPLILISGEHDILLEVFDSRSVHHESGHCGLLFDEAPKEVSVPGQVLSKGVAVAGEKFFTLLDANSRTRLDDVDYAKSAERTYISLMANVILRIVIVLSEPCSIQYGVLRVRIELVVHLVSHCGPIYVQQDHMSSMVAYYVYYAVDD